MPVEGSEMEPIGRRHLECRWTRRYREFSQPTLRMGCVCAGRHVKKGEDLVVRGGEGKTVACAACHGDKLKGNDISPGWRGVPRAIWRGSFMTSSTTRATAPGRSSCGRWFRN